MKQNITNKILFVLFTLFIVVSVFYVWYKKDTFLSKFLMNKNVSQNNVAEKQVERTVVQEENSVISAIEKAKPAVVSVITKSVALDPYRGFFEQEGGIGTGFLVEGGFVFTNKHVVEDTSIDYKILLNDGKTSFAVSEITRDPVNDFAILKIDNPDKIQLPFVKLGSSKNLKVGQTVIAIGNALGEFQNTASKGIISGIGRTIYAGTGISATGGEYLDNVIQTDAALNPGNSGGPLIDLSGEVIGINVAKAGGGDNVGFSIPIDSITPVYEGFKTTGTIQRPFLGIEYYLNTGDQSALNRVPIGAVVTRVVPDTPAQKAGLKQYDVILEVDGEAVSEQNPLSRIIVNKKVGSEIKLKVDRNGKILEITVKLEAAN